MNQIIEVKIIKRKVNYIATSSLFPTCKGIGKTKKEALAKLSKSISKNIASMVEATLESIFLSDNYTQVMLDQSSENHEQSIAFSLNYNQKNMPSTFLLKVSSFSEEDESDEDNEFGQTIDDVSDIEMPYESVMQTNEDVSVANDMFEQLTLQQKSSQDPDAIVFGFPLNFN